MSGKPKADLSFPDNVAVQGDRKYLETYQNKNFEAKNNSCINILIYTPIQIRLFMEK